MKETLVIRTPGRTFEVPEGRLVKVKWKSKNKQRPGECTGVGWIKRGPKPHSFLLVREIFETYDQVEREYSSTWTIWDSRILEIRQFAVI